MVSGGQDTKIKIFDKRVLKIATTFDHVHSSIFIFSFACHMILLTDKEPSVVYDGVQTEE